MANSHEIKSAVSIDMLSYAFLSARKITTLIPKEFRVRNAEVIGWRPMVRLKRIVADLEQEGIAVSDFHLRTGIEARSDWVDTLKIALLQQIIHSVGDVTAVYPNTPILIHAPEAESRGVFRSLLQRKPNFLWVENHASGLGGLRQAKRLVHLYRANGIPSAVMFDGAHAIGANPLISKREFRMHWDLMLAAKTDPDVWGEHVPISTANDDGFPMDRISFAMWRDYASRSSPNLRLRVIENQQREHLVSIPKSAVPEILKRNEKCYGTLQQTGVVNFQ